MIHLSFKMPDNFNLFLIGDDQYGSSFHFETGVDRMLNLFHSNYKGCKSNYAWHHGDSIEGITTSDSRFTRQQNQADELDDQIAHQIKKYSVMGKRLLGQNNGNHEQKNHRVTNCTQRICDGLNIINGTISTIITYVDRKDRIIFKHHAAHGYKSINSSLDDERERRFAMERSLRRLLMRKHEDCLLNTMGHTHKLLTVCPVNRLMLMSSGKELQAYHTKQLRHGKLLLNDQRWYGNTGSFMRQFVEGIEGYGEQAGYDPIDMGFLICCVRNKKIISLDEIIVG